MAWLPPAGYLHSVMCIYRGAHIHHSSYTSIKWEAEQEGRAAEMLRIRRLIAPTRGHGGVPLQTLSGTFTLGRIGCLSGT